MAQYLDISRKVALKECKKIFVQRDYELGYEILFETTLPAELQNKIDVETWTSFIRELNHIYSSANAVSSSSIMECALGLMTCYLSRLCIKSVWDKRLNEAEEFLTEMNNLSFIKKGFYVCNPIERGLRALEIVLLDEPDPLLLPPKSQPNNINPPPLQPPQNDVEFGESAVAKIARGHEEKQMSESSLLTGKLHDASCKGLYALLPIGQRCVDKLNRLIETEMLSIGAQKIELPQFSERKLWVSTNRWQEFGSELFRFSDRSGAEFCLQPTAEELTAKVIGESVGIPRDNSFPILVFQCNQKYRDEPSPKFGLLRSRHFLMNDLYSFDRDESAANATYEMVNLTYERIFHELLTLKKVFRIEADNGPMGGNISHEFHMLNESCEDQVDICKHCGYAKSSTNNDYSPNCSSSLSSSTHHEFECKNTIEVAHTFQLGTKYSKALNVFVASPDLPYNMCSFGIGLTRLVAASIDELSVNENAMRLPYAISPFKVAFILPKRGQADPQWNFAWSLLNELNKMPNLCNEIFVDDRLEKSVGRRLVDANRLGIPHIFVCNSKKTDNPYAIPTVEYFSTTTYSSQLSEMRRLTHATTFQLAKSM